MHLHSCLVKYFSSRVCAFEIHVVMRHTLTWICMSRAMLLSDQTEYWCELVFFNTMCVCKLLHGMPYFIDSAWFMFELESWEITW
jgi:hypothetical protein